MTDFLDVKDPTDTTDASDDVYADVRSFLKPKPVSQADTSVVDWEKWKATPNNQTRSQLLRTMQPVIDGAVRGHGDSPYLRAEAKLVALKAFDTYDPKQGPLKNHLISHLQGLSRISGKADQIIQVPERRVLQFNQLQAATRDLEDAFGREPTDIELADYLGVPTRKLTDIRKASLPMTPGKAKNDETGVSADLAVTRPGESRFGDAWQQLVYDDLATTDKLVMEHSLGLNGKPVLTTGEIARKVGLTAGAVSQRKAKIQEMLDARFQSSFLGD